MIMINVIITPSILKSSIIIIHFNTHQNSIHKKAQICQIHQIHQVNQIKQNQSKI